jgi:hypothetical protein
MGNTKKKLKHQKTKKGWTNKTKTKNIIKEEEPKIKTIRGVSTSNVKNQISNKQLH